MRNSETNVVSVIIPVFNCEKYLIRCLDSVVAQTYANLEVLLIDDCSLDGSLSICRLYESKYPNIRVLRNEERLGVSSSRNIGLEQMIGEYTIFIDGDDYIDRGFVQHLVDQIRLSQADLVINQYVRELEDGTVTNKNSFKNDKIDFCFNDNFDSFAYYAHRGVWSVIFKKSALFKRNSPIRFNENIKIGEDLLFFTEVLINAKKVRYISDDCRYHYVLYNISSYHDASIERMLTGIDAHREVVKLMCSVQCYKAAASARTKMIYKLCEVYELSQKKETTLNERRKIRKELLDSLGDVMKTKLGIRFKYRFIKYSLLASLKN